MRRGIGLVENGFCDPADLLGSLRNGLNPLTGLVLW